MHPMVRDRSAVMAQLERMILCYAENDYVSAYNAADSGDKTAVTESLLRVLLQQDMLDETPTLLGGKSLYDEYDSLDTILACSTAAEKSAALEELECLRRSASITSNDAARAVIAMLEGHTYAHGFQSGGKPDVATAIQHYQAAALASRSELRPQGLAAASYNLGVYTDDPVLRIRMLTSASEQGHELAMCKLAEAYKAGSKPNVAEAVRLLRLGMERGSPIAAVTLAQMCGTPGIHVGAAELFRILSSELVVRAKCCWANTLLGMMYDKGMGTQRNSELAELHLRMASDRGYGPASSALSDIYMSGMRQVKADVSHAVHLIRAGVVGDTADFGCVFRLGYLHITGKYPKHVAQDVRTGVALLRAADVMAKNGCPASHKDTTRVTKFLGTFAAI